MSEHAFDAMTRRAAAVSRRASLLTLGTAGLATLASPLSADAKNRKKNNNNKCKKDKKDCRNDLAASSALCPAQVDQCTTFVTALCEGDPDCLDSIPCCSVLATCDFTGFFACLVGTGAS